MIPKIPPEILDRQNAGYRAMTTEQKWRLTFDLMEQGIHLARLNIEQEHPDWTREKVDRALRRRLWPRNLCEEFEAFVERRTPGPTR